MKLLKHAVASLALLSGLAGPAFAQGEGVKSDFEGTVMVTTPGGAVVQKKMTDKSMMDMMAKEGMPMTPGSMMMMHQGKMYTVPDKKMPDGRMMSDMVMSK